MLEDQTNSGGSVEANWKSSCYRLNQRGGYISDSRRGGTWPSLRSIVDLHDYAEEVPVAVANQAA